MYGLCHKALRVTTPPRTRDRASTSLCLIKSGIHCHRRRDFARRFFRAGPTSGRRAAIRRCFRTLIGLNVCFRFLYAGPVSRFVILVTAVFATLRFAGRSTETEPEEEIT